MKNGFPLASESHILDNQHRGIQTISRKRLGQITIFDGLGLYARCQVINGRIATLPEKSKEGFCQPRLKDFLLGKMAFENPKRDVID